MSELKIAARYFLLVFAAGFLLGAVRVLLVVPALGTVRAELLEAPLMLTVTFAVARWLVGSHAGADILWGLVGALALCLLLGAEFVTAFGIRRLSLSEFLAGYATPSGAVFVALLALFAAMPKVLARGRRRS